MLMERNDHKAITMTDIINKSDVSRAGVYNNYKSKKKILPDICREPRRTRSKR